MRYRWPLIILALSTNIAQIDASQSSCVNCHLSPDIVSDTTIASDFINSDVHSRFGLDCSDCHGGDPKHGFDEQDPDLAMNPAKGYKPPPDRFDIPEFCAACHSDIEYMKKYNPALPADQFQLYKTSIHGKQIFNKHDSKAAVCTDCHGAHGILPSSDSRSKVYHNNIPFTCSKCHSDKKYMDKYSYEGHPLPTDQFDKYKQSIHGVLVLEKGDKSAPACNNCHGNHGASPPNLASVSAACGECHSNNQVFFNNSPHKKPWIELGLPECEQCHGNHLIKPVNDDMLGVKSGALCIECHDQDSPGFVAAAQMKNDIDTLKTVLSAADSIINQAEQKGIESSEASFDLGKSKDALTQVRSIIHTFDPEKVAEITLPAVKNAINVRASVNHALQDIKTRQYGLWISLLLIIIIIILLRIKIKETDKKIGLK
jgi:predicted CXXCH cytochrome family protein